MRIDVVICTWNRCRLLAQTLGRLQDLEVPHDVDWQVIVIDNNCTDDTGATLHSFAGRLPLRAIFEPRPGQSHARNRAVAEATGDYLIWTDDDVLMRGYAASLDAPPLVELDDHYTDGFFPEDLPHSYLCWQLEPGQYHLIEAVATVQQVGPPVSGGR